MNQQAQPAAPSGVVTLLVTDVEGSTRLCAADTQAMSASLQVHDVRWFRALRCANSCWG